MINCSTKSGDETVNWPSCIDFGCIANKLIIVEPLSKPSNVSSEN